MILGIGCDLIEVERISAAIEKGGFVERVYTDAEKQFCTNKQGLPKYESLRPIFGQRSFCEGPGYRFSAGQFSGY
jgi:phosphopantetheinyl transferase (holo-ACP synthase)